jgi:hypothetical protein
VVQCPEYPGAVFRAAEELAVQAEEPAVQAEEPAVQAEAVDG